MSILDAKFYMRDFRNKYSAAVNTFGQEGSNRDSLLTFNILLFIHEDPLKHTYSLLDYFAILY